MSNQAQFNDIIYRLDVTTYGNLTKVTDTISKCRVRIFYKGLNRNRTQISDDFADQLISSLPYAPIKGIFNYSEEDFEDHGKDNTDGKIYGIIPEKNNFAWEKHLDEDGKVAKVLPSGRPAFKGKVERFIWVLENPKQMNEKDKELMEKYPDLYEIAKSQVKVG